MGYGDSSVFSMYEDQVGTPVSWKQNKQSNYVVSPKLRIIIFGSQILVWGGFQGLKDKYEHAFCSFEIHIPPSSHSKTKITANLKVLIGFYFQF
jgi:hypothetical protein